MKKILLLFAAMFAISSATFAQSSAAEKFEEANVLLEEGYYAVALPLFKEVLKEKDNAHINYKVGLCIFNSSRIKTDALPYFEKASKNVSRNYEGLFFNEKVAPEIALMYYGRVLHMDEQLDKAISVFEQFRGIIKKGPDNEEAARYIEQCNYAKALIAQKSKVKVNNLGSVINSRYIEHSPVVSYDESVIFYTSRRLRPDSTNQNIYEAETGLYYEDIYMSYKDAKGNWTAPELLSFNRADDHDATIALSADGQSLYIYKDFNGNGNLYVSAMIDGEWTEPSLLGSNINTTYTETHLSVSADGKLLYFASDRPGGFGGKDIYFCRKLPNGEWGLAINAGPMINTEYDEDSPYIHPDNKTLYFSSNGHKTMGGMDVFFTEKDESGVWQTPMNMGYPINTTIDDIFYIISPDGKRAYYASTQNFGYGESDLYLIEQEDIKEKPLTLLKGFLLSYGGGDYKDKELMKKLSIEITDNETGEIVGLSVPSQRNGSFVFIIPPGKDYNVRYFVDEEEIHSQDIYVPEKAAYAEIQKEIFVKPTTNSSGEEELDVTVIDEELFTDQVKFQLEPTSETEQLPVGLEINYVDEAGNTTATENVSRDGFFKYMPMKDLADYRFKINNKNGVDELPRNLAISLIENGNRSNYQFKSDDQGIYSLDVTELPVAQETKGSQDSNTGYYKIIGENIDFASIAGTTVYAKDRAGNVLDSAKVDDLGVFAFGSVQENNDVILELANGSTNLDRALVAYMDQNNIKDPIFDYQKNGIFTPRAEGLSNETKAYFQQLVDADMIKSEPLKARDLSNGETISLLTFNEVDADGVTINTESFNLANKEMTYSDLEKYLSKQFRLRGDGEPLINEVELSYVNRTDERDKFILIPDENGIYTLFNIPKPEQIELLDMLSASSDMIYNNKTGEKIDEGFKLSSYTTQGQEISSQVVNDIDEMDYRKLAASSSVIYKLTDKKGGEICDEVVYKKREDGITKKYVLTPDENCYFRIGSIKNMPLIEGIVFENSANTFPKMGDVQMRANGETKEFNNVNLAQFFEDDDYLKSGSDNKFKITSDGYLLTDNLFLIANEDGSLVKYTAEVDEDNFYSITGKEGITRENFEAMTIGDVKLYNNKVYDLKTNQLIAQNVFVQALDANGNKIGQKININTLSPEELSRLNRDNFELYIGDNVANQGIKIVHTDDNNNKRAYYLDKLEGKELYTKVDERAIPQVLDARMASTGDKAQLQKGLDFMLYNKLGSLTSELKGLSLNEFIECDLLNSAGVEKFQMRDVNGVLITDDISLLLKVDGQLKRVTLAADENGYYTIADEKLLASTEGESVELLRAVYIDGENNGKELISDNIEVIVNDKRETMGLVAFITKFPIQATDNKLPLQLQYKGQDIDKDILLVTRKGKELTLYELIADKANGTYNLYQVDPNSNADNREIIQTINDNVKVAYVDQTKRFPNSYLINIYNANKELTRSLLINSTLEDFDYEKIAYLKDRKFGVTDKVTGKNICEPFKIVTQEGNKTIEYNLTPDEDCMFKLTGQRDLLTIQGYQVGGTQASKLPEILDYRIVNKDDEIIRAGQNSLVDIMNDLEVLGNKNIKLALSNNDQPITEDIFIAVKNAEGKDVIYKLYTEDGKYYHIFSDPTEEYTYNKSVNLKDQFDKMSGKDLAMSTTDKLKDPNMRTGAMGSSKSDAQSMSQQQAKQTAQEQYKRIVELVYSGSFEPVSFVQTFSYNKNAFKEDDAAYVKFLDAVVSEINTNGTASIKVESSASKVPTKTFKNNLELSKARAEFAKTQILADLKKRGVDASKVVWTQVNTYVQGPSYQYDHVKNRAVYEKYQYVKLILKN